MKFRGCLIFLHAITAITVINPVRIIQSATMIRRRNFCLFFPSFDTCNSVSSDFSLTLSSLISSPAKNSLTLISNISHSSIYTETSGRQIPRSHFETDLSLFPSLSASCLCVSLALFLFSAIYLPILAISIGHSSFHHDNLILSQQKSTPLKGRIATFTAYIQSQPQLFHSLPLCLIVTILYLYGLYFCIRSV